MGGASSKLRISHVTSNSLGGHFHPDWVVEGGSLEFLDLLGHCCRVEICSSLSGNDLQDLVHLRGVRWERGKEGRKRWEREGKEKG